MQELAPGLAASPDLNLRRPQNLGPVYLGKQRRNDVAAVKIVIVVRTIQIRGLSRDKIATILPPISRTHLQPRDLGNGVPLVGRLQRTGQQRLFWNRLRRQPRIYAGRSKEQKFLYADLSRPLDDIP